MREQAAVERLLRERHVGQVRGARHHIHGHGGGQLRQARVQLAHVDRGVVLHLEGIVREGGVG